MPLSKTIQEISVPLAEYPNLREVATLRDAFAILNPDNASAQHYRHILVLNDKDQLVGLLGMHDIVRGLFPDYLRTAEKPHHDTPVPDFPSLTLVWAETWQTQSPAAAEKPVTDFMSPVPGKLNSDDPVTMAAYLLVSQNVSILPVVDGEQLIGVVRLIDVFNEAARVVLHG